MDDCDNEISFLSSVQGSFRASPARLHSNLENPSFDESRLGSEEDAGVSGFVVDSPDISARIEWLSGVFTPRGSVIGLADYNTEGDDSEPEFLDKSDDPYEWAYALWHEHGLIRWCPASFQAPGKEGIRQQRRCKCD